MKIKSSIKKSCINCKLIKRFNRYYIICINKKHKQHQ